MNDAERAASSSRADDWASFGSDRSRDRSHDSVDRARVLGRNRAKNSRTLNKAKAGSGIPVKFSLGGDRGLAVLAWQYPRSTTTTCGSGSVDDIEQTTTAGSSSLSYDASTGQYTYVWKTDKAWAGSCRQLNVKLTDGSSHVAYFWFVK